MAINIKLNDVSISDHAKVITGVRMSETADFDVQAEKVKVYGDAQFLTDMQIESVVKKAGECIAGAAGIFTGVFFVEKNCAGQQIQE